MKKIIAIQDDLANDLAGPVILIRHDAEAIRYFGDVASHPESQVGRHVEDYQLVELGVLDDDLTIISGKRTILTGAQWKAAIEANERARLINTEVR